MDIWLNTPRRPLEACGTSGQKAVLNGALNLSVLDGWWAEAYDGPNGFAIGDGESHVHDRITNQRNAQSFLVSWSGKSSHCTMTVMHTVCLQGLDRAHDEFDWVARVAIQCSPNGC